MSNAFDLSEPLGQARLAMLAAVVEGDAGLAFDIVSGLMADGVAFDAILFDVIAPLQREVGHRWAGGDFRIAEEHAATSAMETLVALLTGSLEMPSDGLHVVVACAEGDTHSLPARMVAGYLTYQGFRTTFLGSSIPAGDLGDYLAETGPDVLALACALVNRLPGARATIAAAHGVAVPVLVGGRAFGENETRAVTLGADGWAATPQQIEPIIAAWDPDPAAAERHALASVGDTSVLDAARRTIVDTAAETATSQLGTTERPTATVHTEIQLFFDALTAGVLVAEPELLSGFAGWHGGVRSGGRSGRSSTLILLESLRDAVSPFSAGAVHHLDLAVAAAAALPDSSDD